MDVVEVVPETDEEKKDVQAAKIPTAKFKAVFQKRTVIRGYRCDPNLRHPPREAPQNSKEHRKNFGPALIKFFGSQSLSKFTLKRYLDAHHSNATFENDRGIPPLQALCMNDRVSMDAIDQYLQVHPAHIEEALLASAVEGKTALHYLCSNRNATMQTAKVLISKPSCT